MNPQNMSRSDLCEYILYTVPGETNSEQAMGIIATNIRDDVWIQDIRQLNTPLPQWLNGVPTLIHKQSKRVMKGTECIAQLRELRDTTPSSFGGFSSNLNYQSSIMCADTGKTMGMSCQAVEFDNPTLTSIQDDGDSLSTNAVQSYMKLRDAQMSESMKSMRERSMEMVEIQ